MTTPAFQCGLDGDFDSYPELRGWLGKAQALAEAVASMRPKFWRAERVGAMRLPCLVEIDGQQRVVRRLVVVHPLWRSDSEAMRRLGVSTSIGRTQLIDTFELERRPLRALEMVDAKGDAPAVQTARNAQV